MASWEDVTTYDDLQAMTGEQRTAHFRSCIVLDPSTLSPEEQRRLAEMRAQMDARMDAREAAARRDQAS
jgi:hypothetical protein